MKKLHRGGLQMQNANRHPIRVRRDCVMRLSMVMSQATWQKEHKQKTDPEYSKHLYNNLQEIWENCSVLLLVTKLCQWKHLPRRGVKGKQKKLTNEEKPLWESRKRQETRPKEKTPCSSGQGQRDFKSTRNAQSLTPRHGYAVFQNNDFINNGDKENKVSKHFWSLGKRYAIAYDGEIFYFNSTLEVKITSNEKAQYLNNDVQTMCIYEF